MKTIIRISIMFIGLILIWQVFVSSLQLPNYILPTPLEVFTTLLTAKSLIFANALPTLYETLLGLCGGIILGLSAAILLILFRTLAIWFLPSVLISQAIPTFAIAPLIVIWLGYGLMSKIVITLLMIFFPITSAFYDGLRRTPIGWLQLAKTMNASRWRIFMHIQIPAALPSLAAGLRIAAVTAPLGAIVGEWVGSSQGLGYLMLNANARMQIDMMFATLLVIVTLALGLYFTVDKIMLHLLTWHE